ncbi:MAG: hypothetical protein ACREDU_04965 [Methylocella sp.]
MAQWLGGARSRRFRCAAIKDSPTYLHGGRLLTLDDTVEFFNLILETKLTAPEKTDLVASLQRPVKELERTNAMNKKEK